MSARVAEISDRSHLKLLTPKRLPVAFGQEKKHNTTENLINEIHQILYSLYQTKEVTKKVYNNIMNSVKVYNKMDTMFMNSKNGKTSDLHRLLLNQ